MPDKNHIWSIEMKKDYKFFGELEEDNTKCEQIKRAIGKKYV